MNILVAGLGNVLLMDDGVGVHAVRELQKDRRLDAVVVEVGTAVLDALHLFEWADRIVALDAVAAGGAPGTVYSLGIQDLALPGRKASLHEVDLQAAFRFLPKGIHPEAWILGVEPQTIDYGMELTAPVQAALPRLLQAVKEVVAEWQA